MRSPEHRGADCARHQPLSSSAPMELAHSRRRGQLLSVSDLAPPRKYLQKYPIIGDWSSSLELDRYVVGNCMYVWKMWGIFSYWILLLTGHDWLTDEVCQVGKEEIRHMENDARVSYPPDLRTWSVVWKCNCFCLMVGLGSISLRIFFPLAR
jgi:hypothetical protein